MNTSAIFLAAHTTAKATRNNFATYRAAFSAALKSAYAAAKLPVITNTYLNEKFNTALTAIAEGGRWNGTVYGKKIRNGKDTQVSVYVDGTEFYMGTIKSVNMEAARAEFLAAVQATAIQNPVFGTAAEGDDTNVFVGISARDRYEMSI